jgi:CspA family cold shock protein
MSIGTVKWFNDCKGYGFIIGEKGNDIFVHYSEIIGEGYKSLRPGDRVEYDLKVGPKGMQARKVYPVLHASRVNQ